MKKAEVRADVSKNRLYLELAGFFNDEEMKQIVDHAIEEIKKLKPGFDGINDISEFRPTTAEGAKELERALQFARDFGFRRAIRVVGPSAVLGQMQFARKSREVDHEPEFASSIEEAEEMLDRGMRKTWGKNG
jgi:hypothetical protein